MSFSPSEPSATSVEVQAIGPGHLMRRLRPHGHLFFEVLLFTEGQGTIVVGGRELFVEARTVVAIAPGVQHDCRAMATADGWSIIFLPESADATAKTSFALDERLPADVTFDLFRLPALNAAQPIVLGYEDFTVVLGLVAWMKSELHMRRAAYEIVVRNALQMLLVTISRHAVTGGEEGAAATMESRDFVTSILSDIDEHYGPTGSLRAAAKRLNLQPGHLTTKLRRLTGRTYSSWLTERRMSEARRLLVATTLSLSTIADQLGYTEVESFVRRFRKHHSMTPGAWRSSARESKTSGTKKTVDELRSIRA